MGNEKGKKINHNKIVTSQNKRELKSKINSY